MSSFKYERQYTLKKLMWIFYGPFFYKVTNYFFFNKLIIIELLLLLKSH